MISSSSPSISNSESKEEAKSIPIQVLPQLRLPRGFVNYNQAKLLSLENGLLLKIITFDKDYGRSKFSPIEFWNVNDPAHPVCIDSLYVKKEIKAVAELPNQIVVIAESHDVFLWDYNKMECRGVISSQRLGNKILKSLLVLSSGLLVLRTECDYVSVWDCSSLSVPVAEFNFKLSDSLFIRDIIELPNKHIAILSSNGEISLGNIENSTLSVFQKKISDLHSRRKKIILLPDGNMACGSDNNDIKVEIFNSKTKKCILKPCMGRKLTLLEQLHWSGSSNPGYGQYLDAFCLLPNGNLFVSAWSYFKNMSNSEVYSQQWHVNVLDTQTYKWLLPLKGRATPDSHTTSQYVVLQTGDVVSIGYESLNILNTTNGISTTVRPMPARDLTMDTIALLSNGTVVMNKLNIFNFFDLASQQAYLKKYDETLQKETGLLPPLLQIVKSYRSVAECSGSLFNPSLRYKKQQQESKVAVPATRGIYSSDELLFNRYFISR